jgi:hypothetical protein
MEYNDFAEIDACIARARRMRSEALSAYLAQGWQALKKAVAGLLGAKRSGRHGPFLPA